MLAATNLICFADDLEKNASNLSLAWWTCKYALGIWGGVKIEMDLIIYHSNNSNV